MRRLLVGTALLTLACAASAADARRRSAPTVDVTVAGLVVYGALDVGAARAAIRSRVARAVARCGRAPKTAAAIKLSFLIDERGRPTAVVVGRPRQRQRATCVAQRVAAARLPRAYRAARGELRVRFRGPAPSAKTPAAKGHPFAAPAVRVEARGGGLTTDVALRLISQRYWQTLKKCFPRRRFDRVVGFITTVGSGRNRVRLMQPSYGRAPKKHLCVRGAMARWAFPVKGKAEIRLTFTPRPRP